jgi:hypothetical protein
MVGIAFNLIIIRVSDHKDKEYAASRPTNSQPYSIGITSTQRGGITVTREYETHHGKMDYELGPVGKAV